MTGRVPTARKLSGTYYTPDEVAHALVSWATRSADDERFVIRAPDLASRTRWMEWAADSPAVRSDDSLLSLDYTVQAGEG